MPRQNSFNPRNLLLAATALTLTLAFQNCAKTSDSPGTQAPLNAQGAQNFFQSSTTVTLETWYEPGAEPFVGSTAAGIPFWNITRDNMTEIFKFRSQKPLLNVPSALAQMNALPAQNKTNWLGTEILALQTANNLPKSDSGEARFYIYFLKGYFNSGAGSDPSVIGVHISGTQVIAIFKDVVKSTGANPNGPVPKFVEQSTLVHEMGHALGFVNNGVPLTSNYEDTAHPAHSVNANCVMYWQNEGLTGLQAFIQRFIASSSFAMWGPEVLADAQAISR